MDYTGTATGGGDGGVVSQAEYDTLEAERIASNLHRANGNIHYEVDDGSTTFSTLWSSSKTAAYIDLIDAGTLQSGFDLTPQIDTDVVNTKLIVKSHQSSGTVFECENASGGSAFTVDASGTCAMSILEASSITVKDICIKNNIGTDRFNLGHNNTTDDFELQNATSDVLVSVEQDGGLNIPSGGNLSIGAGGQVDGAQLTLCHPTGTLLSMAEYANGTSPASLQFYKARGSMGAESDVISGTFLGSVKGYGWEGGDFRQGVNFNMQCTEAWEAGAHGSNMVINTVTNSTTSPVQRFIFDHDGKLGIGETSTRYYLPNSRGTVGQVLRDNGGGFLSWQSIVPNSSTNNTIPRFNGTDGILQGSGWVIDDGGDLMNAAAGVEAGSVHVDEVNYKDGSDVDQFTTKWNVGNQLITELAGGGDRLMSTNTDGDIVVGGELLIDGLSFGGGLHVPANLFTATANKTVSNTLSEATMIGTGDNNANLTLPAYFLNTGDYLEFRMSGYMNTTYTPDLTLRFKFAGVTVHTEVMTLDQIPPDQYFSIEAGFVCRSVGASGTMQFSGNFHYQDGSIQKSFGMVNTNVSIVDTTTADVIDVTAEWSVASAGTVSQHRCVPFW